MVSAMPALLNPATFASADTDPLRDSEAGVMNTPQPGQRHAAMHVPPPTGLGSRSLDRFATCPGCMRRVGASSTGDLQHHDVPFTRRRNPKVPQECPVRHLTGQSILGA